MGYGGNRQHRLRLERRRKGVLVKEVSWEDEQQRRRRQSLRQRRRAENWSLVGTLVAAGMLIAFWLAAVLLPLLLMVAAIHYLVTH